MVTRCYPALACPDLVGSTGPVVWNPLEGRDTRTGIFAAKADVLRLAGNRDTFIACKSAWEVL